MSDNNGWPDPVFRFGVPLNPERDQFHWLIRKNGQWPEAWRWNPDADGCGTEYSGAWAESEGDGQPEDMGKWYRYLGPCLTPAEVNARIAQARRNALEEAALVAEERYNLWHMPHPDDARPFEVCDDASACRDIAAAIRALGEKE